VLRPAAERIGQIGTDAAPSCCTTRELYLRPPAVAAARRDDARLDAVEHERLTLSVMLSGTRAG